MFAVGVIVGFTRRLRARRIAGTRIKLTTAHQCDQAYKRNYLAKNLLHFPMNPAFVIFIVNSFSHSTARSHKLKGLTYPPANVCH